jgi:cell filamentation protein
MAYSIDDLTADCYEGTTVLINKLGIKDEQQLEENEAFITLVKSAELETCPLNMNFDFEHFKAVHKYLFKDLYEWAGSVRTVNFSKENTLFCPADEIEKIREKLV